MQIQYNIDTSSNLTTKVTQSFVTPIPVSSVNILINYFFEDCKQLSVQHKHP